MMDREVWEIEGLGRELEGFVVAVVVIGSGGVGGGEGVGEGVEI